MVLINKDKHVKLSKFWNVRAQVYSITSFAILQTVQTHSSSSQVIQTYLANDLEEDLMWNVAPNPFPFTAGERHQPGS